MQSKQIQLDIANCLIEAGFSPPSAAWTRDDPRGRGFGQWKIWPDNDGFAARFTAPEYSSAFQIRFDSAEDISAWIRHALIS